jgi:hypothetical protein
MATAAGRVVGGGGDVDVVRLKLFPPVGEPRRGMMQILLHDKQSECRFRFRDFHLNRPLSLRMTMMMADSRQ